MNNSYYKTLDENFEQALNLYEQNPCHEELMKFLKTGNIVQKQISALKLEKLDSKNDAKILMDNLTGQDGKIREAISMRIKEFMSNADYVDYFNDSTFISIFLDAIVDINSNICRNIIDATTNLKYNNEFSKQFGEKLIEKSENLTDIIEKFDFQQGKYKVNKEVFKLYWCLETIYHFYEKINQNKLTALLLRTKNIQEYTIREKTAKILTKENSNPKLLIIKTELKNDPNYYVRRF